MNPRGFSSLSIKFSEKLNIKVRHQALQQQRYVLTEDIQPNRIFEAHQRCTAEIREHLPVSPVAYA